MNENTLVRAHGILRSFAEGLMTETRATISGERLTETVLGLVEKSQALDDIDTAACLLEHFGPRLRRESHLERLDACYAAVLAHKGLPGARRVSLAERRVQLLTQLGRRAEAEAILAAAWLYADTPQLRACLYNREGYLLNSYSQYEQAQAAYEAGLAEAQMAQDPSLVCLIHNNLGEMYFASEDYEKATSAFEQAIAVALSLSDPFFRALAEGGLGMTLTALAQFDAADAHQESARHYYRLADDPFGLTRTDLNQSYNAYERGDYLQAKELAARAVVQARATGNVHHLATAQQHLGEAYLGLHEHQLAYEHFALALDMRLQMGKPVFVETTSRTLHQLADLVEADLALPSDLRMTLLRQCHDKLKAAQAFLEQPST